MTGRHISGDRESPMKIAVLNFSEQCAHVDVSRFAATTYRRTLGILIQNISMAA